MRSPPVYAGAEEETVSGGGNGCGRVPGGCGGDVGREDAAEGEDAGDGPGGDIGEVGVVDGAGSGDGDAAAGLGVEAVPEEGFAEVGVDFCFDEGEGVEEFFVFLFAGAADVELGGEFFAAVEDDGVVVDGFGAGGDAEPVSAGDGADAGDALGCEFGGEGLEEGSVFGVSAGQFGLLWAKGKASGERLTRRVGLWRWP